MQPIKHFAVLGISHKFKVNGQWTQETNFRCYDDFNLFSTFTFL